MRFDIIQAAALNALNKAKAMRQHEKFIRLNPMQHYDSIAVANSYKARYFIGQGMVNARGARRLLERQIAKTMAKERAK